MNEGDTVLLSCKVRVLEWEEVSQKNLLNYSLCHLLVFVSTQIKWLENDSVLLTAGNSRKTANTRVNSRDEDGDWAMVIKNVKMSDAGQYQCVLTNYLLNFKIYAKVRKLTGERTKYSDFSFTEREAGR